MKRLLVSGFWFLAFAASFAVSACPVCFGNSSSPLAKGTNNGIFFLLVIVGLVQLGFIALFITFWLRARALKRRRESFHLIEGGAH